MDLKETYNRIANDWMGDHSTDTWWVEGTEKYLSYLQQGNAILDVGCGGGVKSQYIIDRGFSVTGIDFSEKMIEIAQERVPAGNFSVQDITRPLKFQKQFDGIFAQAVLLHIPKDEISKTLSNLCGALKPGGYFYIALKRKDGGQPDEQVIAENDYGYEYERFFSFFTLDEIKKYVADAGMEIVFVDETEGLKVNWIQIIAKK